MLIKLRGVGAWGVREISALWKHCRQRASSTLAGLLSFRCGPSADPNVTTYRNDRMKRRDFIALFGGASAFSPFWPLAARAKQAEKIRHNCFMAHGPTTAIELAGEAILDGLCVSGFVERINIIIERRVVAGKFER
jgi:hypothetical protein